MNNISNRSEINLEFARRLKQAVTRCGISWAKLAEQTNIPKSAISAYKSGEYMPKQDKMYRIASCLGVDPSWLLCIDWIKGKAPATDPGFDEQLVQQLMSLSEEQVRFVQSFLDLPPNQAQRVMDFLEGLKSAWKP